MKIPLPPEIKHYEPELRFFFDLMVQKLRVNRHKGFCEGKTLTEISHGLGLELLELDEACADGGQFDVALECADVANFSFLMALTALRQDKEQFLANRGDEVE